MGEWLESPRRIRGEVASLSFVAMASLLAAWWGGLAAIAVVGRVPAFACWQGDPSSTSRRSTLRACPWAFLRY